MWLWRPSSVNSLSKLSINHNLHPGSGYNECEAGKVDKCSTPQRERDTKTSKGYQCLTSTLPQQILHLNEMDATPKMIFSITKSPRIKPQVMTSRDMHIPSGDLWWHQQNSWRTPDLNAYRIELSWLCVVSESSAKERGPPNLRNLKII